MVKGKFLMKIHFNKANIRNIRLLASVIPSLAVIACFMYPKSFSVQAETAESTINVSCYQDNLSPDVVDINFENNIDYEYQSSNKVMYVTSNAINVLKEPSDEGELLFPVGYADKLYVIGEDIHQSNGWTKVKYKNLTGYIQTEYLTNEILFIDSSRYIYVSDTTELRSSPEISENNIIQTVYQNNRFHQVGYNEDWIKIEVNDEYYYIGANFYSSNMIFVEEEKTVYSKQGAILKSEPFQSKNYDVLYLDENVELHQIEYNADWIKVEYNNQIYYIKKKETNNYKITYSPTPQAYYITFNDASISGDLAIVIEKAYSMLGASYQLNSATPTATDCSGLTMQCYAAVGINLPHHSYEQAYYGENVLGQDLRPGDILCFSSKYSNNITHVGIYVGDGNMIHAATYGTGVVLTSLDSYIGYGGTLQAARRFIE